jgi:hypothetical protein
MTRATTTEERPLTLAEICQAIEKGQIVADIEEGFYTLRMRDLVRLARQAELRTKTQQPRPARLAS